MKPDAQIQAVAIDRRLCEAKALAANEIALLCPVGSILQFSDGRCAVSMEVTGYGTVWYDPTTVYGVNVVTGKQRRFYPGYHVLHHVESQV
jgi:hypothetical protein